MHIMRRKQKFKHNKNNGNHKEENLLGARRNPGKDGST